MVPALGLGIDLLRRPAAEKGGSGLLLWIRL